MDWNINKSVISKLTPRNLKNELSLDLGPSLYQGLNQYLLVPSVISKQGWTVTWKPSGITGTFKRCMTCRGTRHCFRRDAFGKVELRICPICHGSGEHYYEKPETIRN